MKKISYQSEPLRHRSSGVSTDSKHLERGTTLRGTTSSTEWTDIEPTLRYVRNSDLTLSTLSKELKNLSQTEKSVAGLLIAKGTSKRLPGKNLKDFHGKPTFLWNVEKCVKIFDKVYVSSDSDEVLALAEKARAIPIKRGEELCGDVPDIEVYQHAYQQMGNVMGIVAVHANNPTIQPLLIERVKYLIELGSPEVMTCYPMTHGTDYHAQHNRINGSIRGMSTERLLRYPDPYKPDPEILIVDNSTEIETEESYCIAYLEHGRG